MIASVLCTIVKHRPKKSLVRCDNGLFRAPCRRCGSAMVRLHSGWELAEHARDDRRRRRLAKASLVLVGAVALAGALIAPHAVMKPVAQRSG